MTIAFRAKLSHFCDFFPLVWLKRNKVITANLYNVFVFFFPDSKCQTSLCCCGSKKYHFDTGKGLTESGEGGRQDDSEPSPIADGTWQCRYIFCV